MYRGLRGQVEGNSVDHSDMPPRRLHLRRYGWAVHHWHQDDRVAVFCQHPRPEGRLGAPECPNSTISGTCVVGCTTGPERAPGDNLRTPPGVCENDGVALLEERGHFPACLVTRCLTSTSPAPIGVSKDCEDIPDGTLCRVAGAVGFKHHTDLSCFANRQLESNSVPPHLVCEEKKCVDVLPYQIHPGWSQIAQT